MLRLTSKNVCSYMLRPTCRLKTPAVVLVSPFISNNFFRKGINTTVDDDEQHKASSSPRGMRMTISSIQKKFPEVKTVETDTLAQWISEGNSTNAKDGKNSEKVKQGRNLVILDVRTEEEAVVSRIPSAIRVDPDEKDMKKVEKIIKEKTLSKDQENDPVDVVMYCSVGYRASLFAKRFQENLKKEGNEDSMNVYNLKGSIFKWTNEDRSLVNSSGEQTKYVHPYNTVFGSIYLDSSLRKFKP